MEDFYKKVKSSALRLLAFRAQSVAEMRQKLERQGFEPALIQQVVTELRDTGYLNDDRFTAEFIRYQLRRKPTGRFLLEAKLKEHGVSDDTISRQLAQEFSADQEQELALQVAREKQRELNVKLSRLSSLQKKKIGQYLSARGFSADLAWETIERLEKGKKGW